MQTLTDKMQVLQKNHGIYCNSKRQFLSKWNTFNLVGTTNRI